ncbi:MAG: hydrogenase maturation protease [Thermodesulfovibrionales bacterium]
MISNYEVKKNILILCAYYPYSTDTSFGYHVFKELEKMQLPDNVELIDVGEFASLIPHIIEGKDKMIVIDVYRTKDSPGTIVRLKPEEIPILWDDPSDVAKFHLLETIQDFTLEGICPETILIGVVPKDIKTTGTEPTPEIKSKIREVVELVIKEIKD